MHAMLCMHAGVLRACMHACMHVRVLRACMHARVAIGGRRAARAGRAGRRPFRRPAGGGAMQAANCAAGECGHLRPRLPQRRQCYAADCAGRRGAGAAQRAR